MGRGVYTLYVFDRQAAERVASAHFMNTVLISDVCSSFCLVEYFGFIVACHSIRGITEDSGFQSGVVYTFN